MFEKIRTLCVKYKEQLLYLIFGGLTTLVDAGITFALYRFWIDASSAPGYMVHVVDTIAWTAAVLFAFFTNRVLVFESKRHGLLPVLGELVTFAGGRVFTLLLQEAIMFVFVTKLAYNKYLFRILAMVLVMVLNYIISKLLVFRKKKSPAEEASKSESAPKE